MQTFLFFTPILQAEMLAFLIVLTSANGNFPLAISAPKDISSRKITEKYEFNLPFLKSIDSNGTLEFAPTNANEEIIYACPAEQEVLEEVQKYENYKNTSAYTLFMKIFENKEPKMCDSRIKPDFLIESNPCTIGKQNPKYIVAKIVYRFGYTKEFVIESKGQQLFFPVINVCFNKDTNRPIYVNYELEKSTEDNLQNLNINDVEELSYNVSDSNLEKHLREIHDAFESQEEKGYVRRLLVPPDHLMFVVRNVAKHYLNVDLLHRELIPLMDVIDRRIKEYAKLFKGKEDYLEIFCLTTNEGKESDKEKTSYEISELAPHHWVKVICNHKRNLAAVIYVRNSAIDYQGKKLCEHQETCNFQEWAVGTTASNVLYQQAYCCAIDENSWLINLLPDDIKVNGFLDINKLQLPDTSK